MNKGRSEWCSANSVDEVEDKPQCCRQTLGALSSLGPGERSNRLRSKDWRQTSGKPVRYVSGEQIDLQSNPTHPGREKGVLSNGPYDGRIATGLMARGSIDMDPSS